MINYPKSFKTTHSWKSCKMTCKTVSFSEMPLDMERYFQIFSNIIQYCQILPYIAWYFTILSNIVLWCKYCFNLSNILKNVNKCSIFGILNSQYCWILSFIVRRCVRYLPIFCFSSVSHEKGSQCSIVPNRLKKIHNYEKLLQSESNVWNYTSKC